MTHAQFEQFDEKDFELMQDKLNSCVLSDILDDMGIFGQTVSNRIVSVWPGAVVVGRAFTVSVVEVYEPPEKPYAMTLEAVDRLSPGDVLIADAGGSERSAFWGELLSTAARARGSRGVVVDGLCRDTRKISKMGFPVFARGRSPLDAKGRLEVRRIGDPVQCGGVRVNPGDIVFGDDDGIVVIPQHIAGDVVSRAFNKVSLEDQVRRVLGEGRPARQAYDSYGVL